MNTTSAEGLPEVVRTAPERIWLQVADDTYYSAEPFPEPASDQITWCADSVMAVEVPYVRADLVRAASPAEGRMGEVVAWINTKYGTFFTAAEVAATERNSAAIAAGELVPLTRAESPAASPATLGEELPVIADYTPVSLEEEAEVDAALGLVKVRMRVPVDLHRELVAESEARGLVLAAVIRERLAKKPEGRAVDDRVKSLLLVLIRIRDSTYRNATQLRGMAHDALEHDRTRPYTTPAAEQGEGDRHA